MNKVKMQFCVYLSQPYKNDYHINNFFGKPPSKRIFYRQLWTAFANAILRRVVAGRVDLWITTANPAWNKRCATTEPTSFAPRMRMRRLGLVQFIFRFYQVCLKKSEAFIYLLSQAKHKKINPNPIEKKPANLRAFPIFS